MYIQEFLALVDKGWYGQARGEKSLLLISRNRRFTPRACPYQPFLDLVNHQLTYYNSSTQQ